MIATVLVGAAILGAGKPPPLQDSARSLHQFEHTSWTIDRGAPGNIRALAQTPDGYLWLGSALGLFRFDGVRFERMELPGGDERHTGQVNALFVTRRGELWVGFKLGGVSVLRGDKLVDIQFPPADDPILQIVEDQDGAVWVASARRSTPLTRYAAGRWEAVGRSWGLADQFVTGLFLSKDGGLWTSGWNSVQVLRRGERRFSAATQPIHPGGALFEDASGRIWVADDLGARPLPDLRGGGKADPLPPGPADDVSQPIRTLVDRNGWLWESDGSHGVNRSRLEPRTSWAHPLRRVGMIGFRAADGLSSDTAAPTLQDREGSIWVGTNNGLDQFRIANVVTPKSLGGLATRPYSIAARDDGSVFISKHDRLYLATADGEVAPISGLKTIETICAGRGNALWAVTDDAIVRLDARGRHAFPYSQDRFSTAYSCGEDGTGGLWVATNRDGLFRLRAGRWDKVSVGGEPSWWPVRFTEPDSAGRVIALAAPNRLVALKGERVTPLIDTRTLRIGAVNALAWDRGLFVAGEGGVARVRDGKVSALHAETYPWLYGVHGIKATPSDTWLFTAAGLVRLSTPELDAAFNGHGRPLQAKVFDVSDGLPGPTDAYSSDRALALGHDGKVWVNAGRQVVWIDPAHLWKNMLPPPVTISALVSNGRRYLDPKAVKLRPGSSNLEIAYTALNLAVPGRVAFRYRLENFDRSWIDPGQRREAFYTNLSPGRYRFHVIAANGDGVWNTSGAAADIDIAPTFVQSPLFIVMCFGLAILLMWFIYMVRLNQIASRARGQLEERLVERERIARELHDTLLQGVQGLLLRFQSIVERLPPSDSTRALMEKALDQADGVLVEGRDRVRDIRAEDKSSLSDAMAAIAERAKLSAAICLQIVTEGEPRMLHPLVQQELERIGEEAISNVVQHAQAESLQISILYQVGNVQLAIKDDGQGIDPKILSAGGQAGHFGLKGLKERAERIRGKLIITSRRGSGTEILVAVPARTAYALRRTRRRRPFADLFELGM